VPIDGAQVGGSVARQPSQSRWRSIVRSIPILGPLAVRVVRRYRRAPVPVVEGYPGRLELNTRAIIDRPWLEPPAVENGMRVVRSLVTDRGPAPVFDIDLFEALNAEYAAHPVVSAAPTYDREASLERARKRASNIDRAIDLTHKKILEFGCGGGWEIWTMSHQFDSEGWGIDLVERESWTILADDQTRYVCADLARDRPFPADFFDRVVSFTVFEHVEHPRAALDELFRVMKPGGLAFVKANLYRGPKASHRYRDVHFPFPHLLFPDHVFSEFYRRRGRSESGAAWVNRLTWEQYEAQFKRVGYRIRMLRFIETPLDEAFYARFAGVLNRYPRADLTRDYFEVVLEKPKR
jgi:SAM-dependent methyltransferase